jgi:hypothetical protein
MEDWSKYLKHESIMNFQETSTSPRNPNKVPITDQEVFGRVENSELKQLF